MVYPHTYRTEHSETITTNSTYGEYYRKHEDKKIPIQPELLKILQYVDSNRVTFLKNLEEAVEIKSISGEYKYRGDVMNMITFTENWLKRLGVKYENFNYGYHELGGKKCRIPPIILGSLGKDSKKKTVCVYANLDVPPVEKNKWKSDPWKMEERDKIIYGRGVRAGKGPLLCWFHIVLAFQERDVEFPVNLKFCIESMRHQECKGLEEFLATRKQDFFYNVDYLVVCESEWLGEKYPCIVYGTVGLLHFEVTIEKKEDSETDIKEDMEKLFKTMADDEDNILIPNFNNFVQQITPDEESIYEGIQEFDPEEVRSCLPPHQQKWDKVNLLMHFWRLPSIHLDDILECTCDKKDTTKIKRRFVIKLVPRQIKSISVKMTLDHIEKVINELNIENKVHCEVLSECRHWYEDCRSPNYEAARRATIQIYKEDPNMIREDKARLVLTLLHRALEKPILLLPLNSRNPNTEDENECVSLRNYYEGTKLLAAYLFQVSYIDN